MKHGTVPDPGPLGVFKKFVPKKFVRIFLSPFFYVISKGGMNHGTVPQSQTSAGAESLPHRWLSAAMGGGRGSQPRYDWRKEGLHHIRAGEARHIVKCRRNRTIPEDPTWSPRFGVGTSRSPRSVPICSQWLPRFLPICAPCFQEYPDAFRFAPFCSDLFSEQIRTIQGNPFLPTPFAHPRPTAPPRAGKRHICQNCPFTRLRCSSFWKLVCVILQTVQRSDFIRRVWLSTNDPLSPIHKRMELSNEYTLTTSLRLSKHPSFLLTHMCCKQLKRGIMSFTTGTFWASKQVCKGRYRCQFISSNSYQNILCWKHRMSNIRKYDLSISVTIASQRFKNGAVPK